METRYQLRHSPVLALLGEALLIVHRDWRMEQLSVLPRNCRDCELIDGFYPRMVLRHS